jgi:hypothetical protein
MDSRAAAAAWVEAWLEGWKVHDVETVSRRYAPGCAFFSHPFRAAEEPGDYVKRAFDDEDELIEAHFGEPVVDGDRAAVEYWALLRGDGSDWTLAGTTQLRFDATGLVCEHRDYWALEEGRREPPAWLGDVAAMRLREGG